MSWSGGGPQCLDWGVDGVMYARVSGYDEGNCGRLNLSGHFC